MSSSVFPMLSPAHGSETITVLVGNQYYARNFTIHKELLCAASKYFDGALKNGFKESSSGLEMADDCPFAFEILYQWLYSGYVRDYASWYTNDKVPADLLWLRLYKLADCRLVEPLVKIAYARLQSIFAIEKRIAPTTEFLTELYDETGPDYLQRYVAFHTAYTINQGLGDAADRLKFHDALNKESGFGAAVASRLMDMRYSSSFQQHPADMKEFDLHRARNVGDDGEVLLDDKNEGRTRHSRKNQEALFD